MLSDGGEQVFRDTSGTHAEEDYFGGHTQHLALTVRHTFRVEPNEALTILQTTVIGGRREVTQEVAYFRPDRWDSVQVLEA